MTTRQEAQEWTRKRNARIAEADEALWEVLDEVFRIGRESNGKNKRDAVMARLLDKGWDLQRESEMD